MKHPTGSNWNKKEYTPAQEKLIINKQTIMNKKSLY